MAQLKKLSQDEAKLSGRISFILRKSQSSTSESLTVKITASTPITESIKKIRFKRKRLDSFPIYDQQKPYIGYISGKSNLKQVKRILLESVNSDQDRESIEEVFDLAIADTNSQGQIVAFYEHFTRFKKKK